AFRDQARVRWTDECEQAFQDWKKYLSSPPLLSSPQQDYVLNVDGIKVDIDKISSGLKIPKLAIRRNTAQEQPYGKNREVAYFIVVLHDIKSVVVAVRGTETPEDLITDGLCRECNLSEEDLNGLINNQSNPGVRETVVSSFPHYGHSGIVESARELYMQVDGSPDEVMTSNKCGFLSSLLGPGCECDGYKVRIVGHSLGGAVATLLGLKQLKGRYLTCMSLAMELFHASTLS
ncbi:hypothetical protein HPP92_002356, partial [Vanilla planifolia]